MVDIRNIKSPTRDKMPSPISSFSQDVFDDICDQLISGKSLREICRQPGMPARGSRPKMGGCQRTRMLCAIRPGERGLGRRTGRRGITAIADDSTNDWMERQRQNGSIEMVLNREHVERYRQRIDARK